MRKVEDIIKRLELVEQHYVYDDYASAYRDGYVSALKWVLTVHQSRPIYEDGDPILETAR